MVQTQDQTKHSRPLKDLLSKVTSVKQSAHPHSAPDPMFATDLHEAFSPARCPYDTPDRGFHPPSSYPRHPDGTLKRPAWRHSPSSAQRKRPLLWPRLHSHRTGHGTSPFTQDRTDAGRGGRDETRTHTSSRGHTRERRHAIIIGHSLSRHAGHAPRAREPLTSPFTHDRTSPPCQSMA